MILVKGGPENENSIDLQERANAKEIMLQSNNGSNPKGS